VKKRVLLLLAVVALMMVMMATGVATAWAAPKGHWVCTLPDGTQLEYSFGQFQHASKTGEVSQFPNGTICNRIPRK
jgi:hypothetical protein